MSKQSKVKRKICTGINLLLTQLDIFFWVLRQILSGKVRSLKLLKVLFKLKELSTPVWGGFRHKIKLSDNYTTFSIADIKRTCPILDSGHPEFLVELLIKNGIAIDFSGNNVVDIGPADGYYTFYSAQKGAQVTVIERAPVFLKRMSALGEYFGVGDQIKIRIGDYPQVGADNVRNADFIWCLGLIYHLNNLIEGLGPIIDSKATVVIEGCFYKDSYYTPENVNEKGYVKDFNPVTFKAKNDVCSRWLNDYLTEKGFEVKWLKEWQEFVEKPGVLRTSVLYHKESTRKALIALPKKGGR